MSVPLITIEPSIIETNPVAVEVLESVVVKGTALSAVAEGAKKLGQKITEASPEVSDKMRDAALEKTIEKVGETA